MTWKSDDIHEVYGITTTLATCPGEEFCSAIRLYGCNLLSHTASGTKLYGDDVMRAQFVRKWCREFENRRTSGHPWWWWWWWWSQMSARHAKDRARVQELILPKRRASVRDSYTVLGGKCTQHGPCRRQRHIGRYVTFNLLKDAPTV
jgi:hypothetical protein